MMNLWAFVLLGLMAQASNGCIQTGYDAIEQKFSGALNEIFTTFAGKPLPEFATSCGVTATNVNVIDSNTTSTSTVFSSQNLLSISFEGFFTISSDCFSNAVVKFHTSVQVVLSTQNAHYAWKRVTGSSSVSAELVNSVTYHGYSCSSTGTEVERAYKEKCEILVKGLCEGAVHSVITIMNQQCAEFTRNFTYAGYNCHYELDDCAFLSTSVMSYMFMRCDAIGIVNQTKPLTLKAMTPGMITVAYLKPNVITPFIFVANKVYKGRITPDEKSGIFPSDANDGNLEILCTQQAFPSCTINSTGAIATVFLRGSINNESGIEIFAVNVVVKADILVNIKNDILTISISSKDDVQVTIASVDPKFSSTDYDFENIRLLTLRHIPRVIDMISCNIAPLKLPSPFIIPSIDAECAHEVGQLSCVPGDKSGP